MDRVLNIGKQGWRPEKTGSLRGDVVRGTPPSLMLYCADFTQKSWIGKGKQSDLERAEDHVSQPLSSLKDPSSFGAPPKHIHYYGNRAGGSPPAASQETPASTSLGSPAVLDRQPLQKKEEEESQPKHPQGPYRVDTTGLSTGNLPKPPIHRAVQEAAGSTHPPSVGKNISPVKPKPSLPPRLPPRQTSPQNSEKATPNEPPPPYDSSDGARHQNAGLQAQGVPSLNQGAIDRLEKAGVRVPDLGIGEHGKDDGADPIGSPPSSSTLSSAHANVSELQSRFAKMSASTQSQQMPATPTCATKKPPLPPKKSNLQPSSVSGEPPENPGMKDTRSPKPPPVPMESKPK